LIIVESGEEMSGFIIRTWSIFYIFHIFDEHNVNIETLGFFQTVDILFLLMGVGGKDCYLFKLP